MHKSGKKQQNTYLKTGEANQSS